MTVVSQICAPQPIKRPPASLKRTATKFKAQLTSQKMMSEITELLKGRKGHNVEQCMCLSDSRASRCMETQYKTICNYSNCILQT